MAERQWNLCRARGCGREVGDAAHAIDGSGRTCRRCGAHYDVQIDDGAARMVRNWKVDLEALAMARRSMREEAARRRRAEGA